MGTHQGPRLRAPLSVPRCHALEHVQSLAQQRLGATEKLQGAGQAATSPAAQRRSGRPAACAAGQAGAAPPSAHLGCAPSIWQRLSRIASLWGDIFGRCRAGQNGRQGKATARPLPSWLLQCSSTDRNVADLLNAPGATVTRLPPTCAMIVQSMLPIV